MIVAVTHIIIKIMQILDIWTIGHQITKIIAQKNFVHVHIAPM